MLFYGYIIRHIITFIETVEPEFPRQSSSTDAENVEVHLLRSGSA